MIDSSSRFKRTPFIIVNGDPHLSRWVEPEFLSTALYKEVLVSGRYEGRPDLLSQFLYNTTEYYWVLIAYNRPDDPLNWPKSGDMIKAPDLASIIAEQ